MASSYHGDIKYGFHDSTRDDDQPGEATSFNRAKNVPSNSFLNTHASNLTAFAVDSLRPNKEFNTLLGQGMDALAKFLKNGDFNVKEVFKGGSAGKGTTIRGKSDIDIIVFMNEFSGYDNFSKNAKSNIDKLERALRSFDGSGGHSVEVEGTSPFCVMIKLTLNGMSDVIDMDVLPAYDSLGVHGKDQTFRDMGRGTEKRRQYYFSSISPLQVDFVKTRDPALKDLVRLVKDWKKTHFEKRSDRQRILPTSYVLELLTIHTWEKAGSPTRFNIGKGFKAVMGELINYRNINCVWEKYYNERDYRREIDDLRRKAAQIPFILDPANPYNNTAARFRTWDEVAHMAQLSHNKLVNLAFDHKWT